jgi:Family of unknown function (DUF6152)
MTSRKALRTAFGALVAAVALSAAAHHSFPAQYDANQPVSLTGAVTKIEWMNPHTFIYIDVKDPATGEVTNWALELGSPNTLMRLGWNRDSLQTGDVVTVEGARARDGSPLVNARSVVMTGTGKRLFAGSSQGNER